MQTEDQFGPMTNSDQRQIRTNDEFRTKTISDQKQSRTENQIRTEDKITSKVKVGPKTNPNRKPDLDQRQIWTKDKF